MKPFLIGERTPINGIPLGPNCRVLSNDKNIGNLPDYKDSGIDTSICIHCGMVTRADQRAGSTNAHIGTLMNVLLFCNNTSWN